jgi:hypothetical protein
MLDRYKEIRVLDKKDGEEKETGQKCPFYSPH